METALRCLLIEKYEKNWDILLAEIEYALNIAENASTSITPFKTLYEVKFKDFLINIISSNDPFATNFLKTRETIRNDTFDVIKLTKTKIIVRYDIKHKIPDLAESAYLKLAKIEKAGYYISKNSSLFIKKVGPYKILKKISNLAYKLELSSSISRVHPVISVIHLEQAKSDSFEREIPPPALIIFQGREEYVIEKIVRQEKRGR